MTYDTFLESLFNLCKSRGLHTNYKIFKATGISQATLSEVKNKKHIISTLQILKLLNCLNFEIKFENTNNTDIIKTKNIYRAKNDTKVYFEYNDYLYIGSLNKEKHNVFKPYQYYIDQKNKKTGKIFKTYLIQREKIFEYTEKNLKQWKIKQQLLNKAKFISFDLKNIA